MKYFFFIFFIINIFSAPNGNPSYPAVIEEGFFIPDTLWWNFRFGYDLYNSSDLVMQFSDLNKEEGYVLRKIEANSNTANITLNIKERIDIYTEIGPFLIEPEFRIGSLLYRTRSDVNILYRGGFKVALFEIFDFTIGTDVKYSYFTSDLSYATRNEAPINNALTNFIFKEWQIGVGLAQKIALLRPYIGVAYKDTQIKMKNITYLSNSHLDLTFLKKAGMFLGSSLSMGSFLLLNAELRFVNERSVTVALQIRL